MYRGLALIVGHENYTVTRLPQRTGCSYNVDRLEKCLSSRGFKVDVLPDLDLSDVAKAINYNARLVDHSNINCLVVIIMTHGEKGGKLYAKDGRLYYTQDIWKPFIDADTLKGKPKFFLFQACRDALAPPDPLNPHQATFQRPASVLPRLPHDKDCIVAFTTSTVSDKTKQSAGSNDYIQIFCDELDKNADDSVNILNLLTNVNRLALQKGNSPNFQSPSFTSFLQQPTALLPPKLKASSCENDDTPSDVQKTGDQPAQEKYLWSNGGLCIILESLHTNTSEFQQVLTEKLNFTTKKMDLNIKEFAANLQSECSTTSPGCVVVIVFAPLFQRKLGSNDALQWVFTINNQMYPLASVWKHVCSSQLQLEGKPKLVLFLDSNSDQQDHECTLAEEDTEALLVTEHADFLLTLGFGKPFIESLLASMASAQDDILAILTSSMKQQDASANLSHFFSSLRYPVNLHDSSLTIKQQPVVPVIPITEQDLNVPVMGQAVFVVSTEDPAAVLVVIDQEGEEPAVKKSKVDEKVEVITISVAGPSDSITDLLPPQQVIDASQQQDTPPESGSTEFLHPLIRMQELKVGIPYKIEKLEWDDQAKFGPALTGFIRVDDILRFVFFPKRVTKKEYPKRSLAKFAKKPSKFSLVIRRFIKVMNNVTPDFEIVEEKIEKTPRKR